MALYAGTSTNSISIIAPGTGADRPASPASGTLRFNTTTNSLDGYSTSWSNISPSIVTSGLVLFLDAGNTTSYPGSGTTWTDLSGNSNNGTLTNGPTYSSSYGGGLVFDGVNDYVTLNPVIQNFSAFTILSWARPTGNLSASYNGIMFQGQEAYPKTDSQAFSFFVNTRLGSGGGYGWAETRYTMPISVNTTYMFGVTATSTQTVQYINDAAQSTTNYSTISNFNSTRAFQIGKSVAYPGVLSTNYFTGSIFNMMVYNRALTETEISQNFNAIRGRYGV